MSSPPDISPPHFLLDFPVTVPCSAHPYLFHPPGDAFSDSKPQGRTRISEARALCATCPACTSCRDWARETGEFGIWGGETDSERANAGYARRVHGVGGRKAQHV
ncbi:WhiB family transcriptional regulator [Actinacidiphila glaucinigra]|uniref:WhiB family transcriptional regulator n=1 Tax=Actinacidiphila glaucinigra TaxID=235986 RepID=UPI0035DBBDF1